MKLAQLSTVFFVFTILPLNNTSNVIRIGTRHYEPYIYQNLNGSFTDGIEFHLIQTIAKHWNMDVVFKDLAKEIDLNPNELDIKIGGLLFESHNFSNAVPSIPYFQDDLIWCIQKSGKWPWLFNLLSSPVPFVCLIIILGYGYAYGILVYILIQFDTKYKQRNSRDWHYSTLLVALPSVIGIGQRFRPISWNIRIFYGAILVAMVLAAQVALVYWYKFLQIQAPMHQIATADEIIANDFVLKGSMAVKNAIDVDKKYKLSQIQSFSHCGNISICLAQLIESKTMAIGASRQHMLSSSAFDPNVMYCFDPKENIASYPIALALNSEFNHRHKLEEIIQRIFESGLIQKWSAPYQQKHIVRSVDFGSPSVRFEQLELAFYLVLPLGWSIAISAFLAELFIDRKLREGNAARIWMYLEQFFDGKRHYFINLPEKLQRSRDMKEFPLMLKSLNHRQITKKKVITKKSLFPVPLEP